MRACGADPRVTTAHRILERPAVAAEVPTAGLAERGCEPTQIDDRTRSIRQRSASMTVRTGTGKQAA